jgi:hypothetical protein
VFLDGPLGDHERVGDRAIRSSLGHQGEYIVLSGREGTEAVSAAAGA